MRFARLRHMGLREAAGRLRQEARKWSERAGLAPLHAVPLRLPDARAFFAGVSDENVHRWIAEHMPEAAEGVIASADAACEARFDLLGYRGLSFGRPVDWHLDPVSQRRSPLVHWARIDPLDGASVGDHKVIWELNRHQWMVHMAQAFALTGDGSHVEHLIQYLGQWMRANPRGMGINWASSLEASLRLISWCWVSFLVRRFPALSMERMGDLLHGIAMHAEHVERFPSFYFSPNTHLTGEALGLFYAGVVLGVERWSRMGARILIDEIGRQVLPDGVHFEQSTCYQRYTVETYLHFLILAARAGIEVPASVGTRVQQMLDFLLAVRSPDGTVPQIGDADGGSLLPLARRAPGDLRGVFSTAAAFFQRADYAWAAGGVQAETLWLMGRPGMEAFESLVPRPPSEAPSRVFPRGGYAVMQSGNEPDAHALVFDFGPLGCPYSGGHGHADLLSVQCAAFGAPCIVDPGTYRYGVEPEWRDRFRGTAFHSTVTVDGVGQAAPAGPFAWRERPRGRLRRWASTPVYDLADAEHEAYRALADPVVHRRRVIFLKPRTFVIVDDLEAAEVHRAETRYQLAPDYEVVEAREGWLRAADASGRGLFLRAFAGVPLACSVRKGEVAPAQGWVSPSYGRRTAAPMVVFEAHARLPLRVVTVLRPAADGSAEPPAVTRLAGAPGAAAAPGGLRFTDDGVEIHFDRPEVVTSIVAPTASATR